MPKSQFRKGDLVRFHFGTRSMQGEIKEDRGPIGVNGRHLYLVEFRPEAQSTSLSFVELPAEELHSVEDAVSIE